VKGGLIIGRGQNRCSSGCPRISCGSQPPSSMIQPIETRSGYPRRYGPGDRCWNDPASRRTLPTLVIRSAQSMLKGCATYIMGSAVSNVHERHLMVGIGHSLLRRQTSKGALAHRDSRDELQYQDFTLAWGQAKGGCGGPDARGPGRSITGITDRRGWRLATHRASPSGRVKSIAKRRPSFPPRYSSAT